MSAIKIVLDITRLVAEGKLTAQEAERLQALAKRDTGSLAINVLMSLGAVAVAAGIIALEPVFTTGVALAGALGSSTGYVHAVYMLTVNEPSITIAFFALLAGAAYLISQRVGRAYQQLAIIFARVSLILVNFGFWIGSLWGDYPGETWVRGEDSLV